MHGAAAGRQHGDEHGGRGHGRLQGLPDRVPVSLPRPPAPTNHHGAGIKMNAGKKHNKVSFYYVCRSLALIPFVE